MVTPPRSPIQPDYFIERILVIPEDHQGNYDPHYKGDKSDEAYLKCDEVLPENLLLLTDCGPVFTTYHPNNKVYGHPRLEVRKPITKYVFIELQSAASPQSQATIRNDEIHGPDDNFQLDTDKKPKIKAFPTTYRSRATTPFPIKGAQLFQLFLKSGSNIKNLQRLLSKDHKLKVDSSVLSARIDNYKNEIFQQSPEEKSKAANLDSINDKDLYDLYEQSGKIKTKLQNLLVITYNFDVTYPALCSRINRIKKALLPQPSVRS